MAGGLAAGRRLEGAGVSDAGCVGVRVCGCQGVWVSGCRRLQVVIVRGCQGAGLLATVGESGLLMIRVSGCQGVSESRGVGINEGGTPIGGS